MTPFTEESALNHLEENWSDVQSDIGFQGASKLYKYYKILSYNQIYTALSKFESYSLMKATHNHKQKKTTLSQHIRDVFQIDYIYVKELAPQNDDIQYIFCAIDIFSKRAWCNPTKLCNANASIASMRIILNSMNVVPKTIIYDGGPEYNNKKFAAYLKKIGLKLIFSKSNQKASTVERFQKTLQRKMYMYITERENLRYIHILDKIMWNYNITYHSFLKCSPIDVETERRHQNRVMLLHAKKYFNVRRQKPKLKLGDTVRISIQKKSFHRSYNMQRSYERFRVLKINKVLPFPRYCLEDELGREIDGDFLEFELVKVDLDLYRFNIIGKQKKKKKTEYLHRFKGYSSEFDMWQTLDASKTKYF